MLKQRQQFFASLLVVADAGAVAVASYAAWAVRIAGRGEWWPESWENWLKEPLLLFSLPVTLAALWASKLYRPRRDKSLLGEVVLVSRAAAVAVGLLIVVLWATGNELVTRPELRPDRPVNPVPEALAWAQGFDAARLQIAALAVCLPVALSAQRVVFRLVLREMRRRGMNLRHVAVVGTGRLGQIVCRTIGRNSWTGIGVSYFISHHDANRRERCLGRPVVGGLDDLEATLESRPVDAVYLALPAARFVLMPDLLKRLERFAVDVRVVPDVHPRYLPGNMAVSELEGMPILSYRESPVHGLGGVAKRAIDIVGSAFGIVLFSPLMLLIAAAIRIDGGPGRVIFKQRRVGIAGEVFKIYKFRTMRTAGRDPDTEPAWTGRDDPRVFRVGRWLRRTSLDELPQLINVLAGRMSLVGPRPERPELIERFRDDWRGYMLRQHVKAGMTGWAQINGLRGDTSLKKRLQYDLFYIRHWSIWFDLRILFETPFRGFVHKNAH